MNLVLSSQLGVTVQLGMFDAIKDMFFVNPVFLFGIIVICMMVMIIYKKNGIMPKVKTVILLLLFYYYLCVMLTNIVGIPCISEYIRMARLKVGIFNPHINLMPFIDGLSLGFLMNIILFIPLGILCPLIAEKYQHIKNILLIGCGLSFSIEMVQLFTLYRVTDINDLLANVMGTVIGYFCYRIVHKITKSHIKTQDNMWYVPVIIIITTFILGFFR